MLLICAIDLIVVIVLAGIAVSKGLERALPFATFVIVLVPLESVIPLGGLFDLLTQRVVIITLAAFYLLQGSETGDSEGSSTPMKYLMLASIGWMIVSTGNSIVVSNSLKYVLSQLLDLYLLYYIVVKKVSHIDTANKILVAIVSAMGVCCVFGLVEAYRQWSVISLFPPRHYILSDALRYGGRGLRIHSTYPVSHLFGSALAMAIPLALYLIVIAKTRMQKAFLWVAIMLMAWNDFKTETRGPWLAMAVAVVPLLFYRQTRKLVLAIALLTALVMVMRPGVYQTIRGQYIATIEPDSAEHGSYEDRSKLLQIAYDAVSKDPARMLWGYGPDSWDFMGFTEVWENGSVHQVLSVDNDVAGFLEAIGFVGTALMFLILIKPALVAFKNFVKAEGSQKALCLSLCASLAAFLFMSTNVAIYDWGQQGYWVFIVMALAMTYAKWSGADAVPQETVAGACNNTDVIYWKQTNSNRPRTLGERAVWNHGR